MAQELATAMEILNRDHCTCVLRGNGKTIREFQRGIRPLLRLLDSGGRFTDCCAADKVVGKAAAFLYCLLGVRALYAQVISDPAVRVLEQAGIRLCCDTRVPAIRNRTDTGLCPMESAVWEISEPRQALEILRKTLEQIAKEAN